MQESSGAFSGAQGGGRGSARRYVDTFFRYWVIALIPILVLPIAGLALARLSGKGTTVIANLWVGRDSTKHLSYADPLATPAANVSTALQQLLQTTSFDVLVAHESPLYWSTVAGKPNRSVTIVADLSKNVTVAANGPDLVSISYKTPTAAEGLQIVRSVLREGPIEIGKLNQLQSESALSYYKQQQKDARKVLAASTRSLGDYVSKHNISTAQMAERSLFDPTFAALYQAVQSAQVDARNADQKLADAAPLRAAGSSIVVYDPPSANPASVGKKGLILDVAIGLIVGLLLSGGFVVGKTATDHTLRRSDDVTDVLGLPVLSSIPYVPALTEVQNKSRVGAGR